MFMEWSFVRPSKTDMQEHQVFAIYGAMVWSAVPDARDFLRSNLAVGLLLPPAICLLVLL